MPPIAGAGIPVLGGHELDDGMGYFRVVKGARVALRHLQIRGGVMHMTVASGGIGWLDDCYDYDPWGTMFRTEKEAEILVDGGTGGIAGYRSRLSFCVPYISDTPAPDIVFYGVGNSSRIAKFMPERTHGLWRKDPQSKLESTAGHGLDLSVPRP